MKRLGTLLLAIPAMAFLSVAQEKSAGSEQTLSGLLVDAGCRDIAKATPGAPKVSPEKPRDVNVTSDADSNPDPTSTSEMSRGTPDVNRGQAQTGYGSDTGRAADEARRNAGQTSYEASRATRLSPDYAGGRDTAKTGTNSSAGQSGSSDRPDLSAGFHSSCYVSPASNSFALQLKDGRVLRLDSASNQKVASQIQSTNRVQTQNKVFRVKVTGVVDGDVLHITKVQM